MKKITLLFAITLTANCVMAQNGLKIKTALPIHGDLSKVSNIEIKKATVFLDQNKNAQIQVWTQINDSTGCSQTYFNEVISVNVPEYDMTPVYNIIKQYLIAKGLDVVDL